MTWGNVLKHLAQHIGISDYLLAECPWLESWIKLNHEHLERDELCQVWWWKDDQEQA